MSRNWAFSSGWTATLLASLLAVSASGGPPSKAASRRAGAVSANLGPIAERIVNGRCNLLLVGDSIATHMAQGDRGTWVTGIWRSWKPEAWRGRFMPATSQGTRVNGTRLSGSGFAPGFDPNCESIGPDRSRFPGSEIEGFDSGWWSLPVHPHLTTGDLADRSLARFEIIAEEEGRDYWSRYRGDAAWANGELRGTALFVTEPSTLDRLSIRGRRGDGSWTGATPIDIGPQLPLEGTWLASASVDFTNPGTTAGDSVMFEVRTDPDEVDPADRSICLLGGVLERSDRETGLLVGSTSCGGDTTRSHLPEGEEIPTDGALLHRYYDDAYLARFIELVGWDTFVVTLGSNDIVAKGRSADEVLEGLAAVIDRYRTAVEVASRRRSDLQSPLFLVVSPMTAASQSFDATFAALDERLPELAGGDVAVIRLHELFHAAAGDWYQYRDQLLSDITHPNDAGAMLMAELVWDELVASVAEPPSEGVDPLRRVPEEFPTVGDALVGIEAGQVVLVGPGTHPTSAFIEREDVVLCSVRGPQYTTLSGGGGTRVLEVSTGSTVPVELRDFHIADGRGPVGGGVRVADAAVVATGCRIEDCVADESGGGVAVLGGTVALVDCMIDSCQASIDGGATWIGSGSLVIENGRLTGNQAGGFGGSVAVGPEGFLEATETRFSSNEASSGGAIRVDGTAMLEALEIIGNSALVHGGALAGTGSVTLLDSDVRSNSAAQDGAGIWLDSDLDSLVDQCRFEENVAGGRGGGLAIAGGGQFQVRGCDLVLLRADGGGAGIGIDSAEVSIETTLFEALASDDCNALSVVDGTATIAGCVFCPDAAASCGTVIDGGGNDWLEQCDGICEGDFNLDGVIDGGDLGLLFTAWGLCPPASYCRQDLDRDGRVDGLDLGLLLLFIGDGQSCSP